jgi:hypothetical protein
MKFHEEEEEGSARDYVLLRTTIFKSIVSFAIPPNKLTAEQMNTSRIGRREAEAEEERNEEGSSSIEIGVGFKEFASVSNEGYGHHSRGVGSQIQKQIPPVPVAAHLRVHSSN